MKISAFATTIIATKLCMLAAQTLDNSTFTAASCYLPCEGVDEYCENSTGVCRGPSYDGECFNPATGGYQNGCDPGFDCIGNKCDYENAATEGIETESSSSETGCGLQCDVLGEYCDSVINECRGPSYDGECFNAAGNVFQDGCDEGYECIDNMCQVITSAPTDNAVCYLVCSEGNYCETGTNECRGPNYDGECFNPATGFYQNGCDPSFTCSNNQCA